jgi:hypothetical protein
MVDTLYMYHDDERVLIFLVVCGGHLITLTLIIISAARTTEAPYMRA